MKKIIIILLVLACIKSSAQTGYTNINQRYNWLAGIFKALSLPGGSGPAAFQPGQHVSQTAIYVDTLGVDAGIYRWDGTAWVNITGTTTGLCDEKVSGGSVTYTTGFTFAIAPVVIRADCNTYNLDSASITIDTADDNYDRYDVFYADATGVHVLEGTAEELAFVPPLEAGQVSLGWVRIPANASAPDISQLYIYRENTEWTGAVTGSTANFDNTSNVYEGSKAVSWTGIGHLDNITFTNGSTVDLRSYQGISIHIRLTAAMIANANLYIRFYNGSSPSSYEVVIPITKNAVDQYQAISIPLSAFTVVNNNVDRVRIRYGSSGVETFAGMYIDYVFLESGITLPGGTGNNVSITMPPAFTVQDNNDAFEIDMAGTTAQYLRGDGTLGTKDWVTKIGAVNNYDKVTNGLRISGDTLYGQTADADDVGFLGDLDWRRFDTTANLTVENLGDGYPVMTNIDDFATGFKTIKFGTEYLNTDTTIVIDTTGGNLNVASAGAGEPIWYTSGDTLYIKTINGATTGSDSSLTVSGGGSGFFSPNQTATGNTEHISDHAFILTGTGAKRITQANTGTDSVSLTVDNQHVIAQGRSDLGILHFDADFSFNGIAFSHWDSIYTFANMPDSIADDDNYMLLWNDVTLQLYKAPLPTGGGGGSGLFPTTGTGTATGAVVGELDGNTLSVQQGGNDLLKFDPSVFETTVAVTDGTAISGLNIVGNTSGGAIWAQLYSTDGVNESLISADGDDGTISYEATNTHTFSGGLILNALAGSGSGFVAVDNDGLLSFSSGGGSGITTLNTLTDASQTFAVGTTAQSGDMGWVSATGVHTLHVPDATTGVRGVVSTGTQTFQGAKTVSSLFTMTAGFQTSATAANANLYVGNGQTATTNNNSRNLFAGAAAMAARVIESGSTTYTVLANSSYTHHVIGAQLINTAATGTHAGLSGLVIHPPVVSSAGGATVTDMSTLWITGVPSGVSSTNPAMAIRVDAGGAQFVNGNLSLGTAGNKINIATGSNASVGTSGAMTAGTITISTTAVTSSSIIVLTPNGAGTGQISVGTITNGTSFVINSSDGSDTRTVNWVIIN